jgi:hypothetical protein
VRHTPKRHDQRGYVMPCRYLTFSPYLRGEAASHGAPRWRDLRRELARKERLLWRRRRQAATKVNVLPQNDMLCRWRCEGHHTHRHAVTFVVHLWDKAETCHLTGSNQSPPWLLDVEAVGPPAMTAGEQRGRSCDDDH